MSFELEDLRALVAEHGVVGRIVIASHQGSAPRETGTSMLVWATGQSGTIGGGALEFEAVASLRARLAKGGAEVARIPLGPSLGQCCGGAVTLVSEVFDDVSVPGDAVFARRVEDDAEMPLKVSRALAQARNGNVAMDLVFDGGWLVEPLSRACVPLWIYGAGHVGRALIDVLSPLPDFEITWVDTGPERFPKVVPESVRVLPAVNPADAVALAPKDAFHLVLTYSHTLDLELCHRLLSYGFAEAGLIGSDTKWARFRRRLAALGHSDAQISRIRCPIGQKGLGKHPQAIALGTAAALLSVLRASNTETRATGGRDTGGMATG
ncbi:MAG: xanthine dehydrogenase accessory protein XdhC [Pseudomonadota bacterium]